MTNESGSTIVFDNLIEASKSVADIGKPVAANVASPFTNKNAPGIIGAMSEQEVAERAAAFGARCKTLMPA